jgi:HSP20 family molecular chaperone IbpA
MIFRLVAFMVAMVFSPPVLFLCLVALMVQTWEHHPLAQNFKMKRLLRMYFGPGAFRRLRRFCGMNNNRGGGGGGGRGCGGGRNQCGRGRGGGPQNNKAAREEQAAAKNAARQTAAAEGNEDDSDAEFDSPFEVIEQPSVRTHYQGIPFHRNETDDGSTLTLGLDVPGFATDAIKISVEQDGDGSPVLVVHGERENRIGDIFVVEERFELDEGSTYNLETVQANHVDGVLEITLEKKPAPQPRIISISVTNNKKDV